MEGPIWVTAWRSRRRCWAARVRTGAVRDRGAHPAACIRVKAPCDWYRDVDRAHLEAIIGLVTVVRVRPEEGLRFGRSQGHAICVAPCHNQVCCLPCCGGVVGRRGPCGQDRNVIRE